MSAGGSKVPAPPRQRGTSCGTQSGEAVALRRAVPTAPGGARGRGLAVGTRWWQWEGHGQMCLLSSCSSESAFPSAFPHSWLSIPHPRGRFTLKAKLCPSKTCWLRVELSCSVLWRCFSTRLSHSSVERGLIRSLLLESDVLCKAPRPEGAAGFGYRHCLFAVVCKGVLSLELGFMQPLRTPNL